MWPAISGKDKKEGKKTGTRKYSPEKTKGIGRYNRSRRDF
jgi:hypothetical protein